MGQLLSRFNFVIATVRELGGEYSTVQKRVNLSPGLPVNDPTLPYWTVPPVNLPGRNNTALPTHVDVLIIGSGITGVSCARTLLKKGPPGLRVLVLEARDVCSGATGR
jgi:NADPH-dependent 2,4-dienoyl-CoA reductase/sulfur reductase-like enzyme